MLILLFLLPIHSAVSNRSMRLFVIGHCQKGKSTILKTLKGEKPSRDVVTRARSESTSERRFSDKDKSE